ncbi:MAG: phenylalanine--tRNA ligase subunit beta [Bacteroidota bacterium]
MKISYNWLKEYIDFDYTPAELGDVLTNLGLEIGKIEEIGGIKGGLKGVVVGHVESAEQHPNADRLRVCKVNVGGEEALNIVCGAPNVAAGQKVAVATVGTILYPFGSEDPLKIKKGKIRGEVSLGMICAEDELGIGTDHDGILVLDEAASVGEPAIDYLTFEQDFVLEIDLTPNRIDGASHYGAARDVAAYMRKQARLPEISLKASDLKGKNPIPVTIEDQERCRRYASIYIEGVTVTESPEWLKKRLQAIGLRPINNIVDITNYVLHELGQPMHAFDADQLSGKEIIVKTLPEAQKFTTLDEVERELIAGQDLMICDAEKPLCIAGTMGGINSGVTFDTKNVFLEIAWFDPGTVRKTSKRLGISSDSSFRYERGADPEMIPTTAMRAASLMVELAGGTASEMSDVQYGEFAPYAVDLSLRKTARIVGQDLGKEEVIDILKHLEVKVEEDADGDTLHLQVPFYRVDVQRDVDVMEDILRVYGYNNVALPEQMSSAIQYEPYRDAFRLKENFANRLSATGFYEVLNNSLVNEEEAAEDAVHIVNPLGPETGIMRQSLLPGILENIQFNQNRQNEDLAFYEFGKTYWEDEDGYHEHEWLAMAITGQKHPTHWEAKSPKVSLATLAREVERIQNWFGFKGEIEETEQPDLAYGLSLVVNKEEVLWYGKVNEELAEEYDLRNEVFYLIADWPALVDLYYNQKVKYQPIANFPGTRRDISMLVDEMANFDEIRKVILKANPKLIRSVDLHDVYMGKGIPAGKKSYLVSMELRDDRQTIADKAADKTSQRAFMLLEKELGAEIRK